MKHVASSVFPGCTISQKSETVISLEKSARSFNRFPIYQDEEEVGTIIVFPVANPSAGTVMERVLLAPKVLNVCVVIDRAEVLRIGTVIMRGNATPGVPVINKGMRAWTGLSLFELAGKKGMTESNGGNSAADAVREMSRSIIQTDYGSAVLARCETPATEPVALRPGDFIPSFEAATVEGRRVNLGTFLAGPSIIMNCDPNCGTCFDMTVDLFNRLASQPFQPMEMVVLMQASVDSDRGRLLVSSLPGGVDIIEDPDSAIAKHMGMNVSAFVVLVDMEGTVRWSRRIALDQDIARTIYQLAAVTQGGR